MIKTANKFSLLCILILLFNQQYSYAHESADQKQATESPFVLRVTYKNYGNKSKHLVKIGIKVSNLSRRKWCAGMSLLSLPPVGSYFSEVLQPQADYIIHLHISNDETIIDVYPPIAIKPDEASYFTISFFPSTFGSCTELNSFEVSGILIFDDGEKVYFTPEQNRITGEEVNKFINRTPTEKELLAAINNRNIDIRRQAFSQLSKSTLDSETIKFLIRQGLGNDDPGIRAATSRSASKLGYKIFTKQISSLLMNSLRRLDAQNDLVQEKAKATKSLGLFPNFKSAQEEEKATKLWEALKLERIKEASIQTEIADYCTALGGLGDADGIDALVATLNDLNFEYPDKISDALIKLNHPDVINKVRPLLSTSPGWFLTERNIIQIITAYRDVKSIGLLLDLANKFDDVLFSLVSNVDRGIDKNQIIRDPFILGLRPAFEKALKNSSSYVRLEALKILTQMPLDENLIQGYFRILFNDSDFNNRVNAADLAADLGYKSLIGEIIPLLKSSKSEWEKERYCTALAKLSMPCK